MGFDAEEEANLRASFNHFSHMTTIGFGPAKK
jgi:hypothetical protein